MKRILIIILSIVVILVVSLYHGYRPNKTIKEHFAGNDFRPIQYMPLNEKHYSQNNRFVPNVEISTGFEEIEYPYTLSEIKAQKFKYPPLYDHTELYCKKNPLCYPCTNWKFIGNPTCP
jgi:hypothetical protein